MREILFRGRGTKGDNKWIEGDLLHGYNGYVCITKKLLGVETWQVDPKTVGQYTGLCDRDGKKIFEGDIVRYVEGDIGGSEGTYIGAICFEPEKAGFAIKRDDYRAFFVNSWLIDIEVIGNIYDNPELMRGVQ